MRPEGRALRREEREEHAHLLDFKAQILALRASASPSRPKRATTSRRGKNTLGATNAPTEYLETMLFKSPKYQDAAAGETRPRRSAKT